jgi:hypothetical protein
MPPACRDRAEGEEMTMCKEKKDSMKDDVEGWIASNSTDRIADYAARGRKHQRLTDDELTAAWVAAFRGMADNVADHKWRDEEEDAKSEMLLRNREPPYGLVKAEFDKFIAETSRAIEDLERNDPVRFAEMNREIEGDLTTFKEIRDRTKS